jgi:mono/diheme cytochrome c family protein
MIVEGSVQRSGDKVLITAKLLRPSDERQLWGRSFERNVGDVLALQSEMAGAITNEIGVRLSEEATLQLAKRRTVNPLALDAYLKGVYSGDMENFAQAIKIDPDFAQAYTKMAGAYFYSGLFGALPPLEAFSKMKAAALKALEKDDTLGEAHGFLAVAYLHNDLNWAGAEKEFKRAFVLNPSLAEIHHLYAHYLMAMNRIDESLSEIKLAEALDPFSWDKSQCFGWHCLFAKGTDEAIGVALEGVRADPTNSWAHIILGWAYEQKSMVNEAIAEFQAVLSESKESSMPLAGLAHVYAVSGRKKEALEILGKLFEKSKRKYVPAYDIAVVYEGLGDDAKTFELSELVAHGEKVYQANCATCHQTDGMGLPGAFPAINGSRVATGPIADHLQVVMSGRPGTAMAAFADRLSDADLAAVVTYQRNAWNNKMGDAVQPAQIAAARGGAVVAAAAPAAQ